MSTVPNAAGSFLGTPPSITSYAALSTAYGTFVKPGGRIAAYVRSTGALDGDDYFAASGMLVASINEGCKRCRANQNDVVIVLPGHVETYTAAGVAWANLVAGTQIVSAGDPGSPTNATLNLNQAAASLALNVNGVALIGMNIVSSTAALTAAIVITGSGCSLIANNIQSSGAGAANSLIQITGAANTSILGNFISANTATPTGIIAITGAASTEFVIQGNVFRQQLSGFYVTTAATAGISGVIANNFGKTAGATPAASKGFTINAANIATVGNFENYVALATAAAGLLADGT